jgi:hypothetical protein
MAAVRATYTVSKVFVVPEDVDLSNKEKYEWWVKWGVLMIRNLKTDVVLQIEPKYDGVMDDDYKHPDEATVCTLDSLELE